MQTVVTRYYLGARLRRWESSWIPIVTVLEENQSQTSVTALLGNEKLSLFYVNGQTTGTESLLLII